jgi:hypothetical protein
MSAPEKLTSKRPSMTDDRNERGLRDGIAGLEQVRKTLTLSMRRAEQRASEAEAELLSYRQLAGYVDIQIEEYRERLQSLETAP